MAQYYDQIFSVINNIGLGIVILAVGYAITTFISNIFYRTIIIKQGGNEYGKKSALIVKRIITIIIMIFILLTTLNLVGLQVTLLIGGMTFALGYAMEEILSNMFGGLMLITNPKYTPGDIIQVMGDIQAFGTLESITARNTIIRSFDKRNTIIPNLILANAPIKTFSKEELIRFNLQISVHRDTDIPKASQVIKNAIKSNEHVTQKEYTEVIINSFNEQGILLDIYFFYDPRTSYNTFNLRSELRNLIFTALKNAGITIPFPKRLLINKV